ncbi:MAG: hypothetical protein Q8N47_01520 [Bryobacterales bacterium]|nr:hypothetical protein [Bryobacterales bacterium]
MRITIPGRVSRVVALIVGAGTLLTLLADVAAGQSQTAKLYGRFVKISIYNNGSPVPDSTKTEHSADWKYQSAWEGSSLAGKITVSVVPDPANRYTVNNAEGVMVPDQPVNVSVNSSGTVQVKCEKDTNCGNATFTMRTFAVITSSPGRSDKGCQKEDVKKGVKLNTSEGFSAMLSCPLRELSSSGDVFIEVGVTLTAEIGPFWSQLGAGVRAGVDFDLGYPSLTTEPSGQVEMKDDFSETVTVKNERTRGVGPLEWNTTVPGGANGSG